MRYIVPIGLILFLVAVMAWANPANAHVLKPAECPAYASDAKRFMQVKIEGWPLEDAMEGLRKMFADGRWFTYVRDKDDVERMKNLLTSMWAVPDQVSPDQIHDAALMSCDPDNLEQYRFMFQNPDTYGI